MSIVASFLCVPMLAASVLIDVVTSVAKTSIIDEALLDRHSLLASRRWLLVDRHFSLVSRWLGVLLCGCPLTSRS